ncbi:MAG: hypothetical protein K9G62_06325 [Alphaproteobacteria bacterium]|nr:hypothetical protein [Alphaproteobacteria bacterium]
MNSLKKITALFSVAALPLLLSQGCASKADFNAQHQERIAKHDVYEGKVKEFQACAQEKIASDPRLSGLEQIDFSISDTSAIENRFMGHYGFAGGKPLLTVWGSDGYSVLTKENEDAVLGPDDQAKLEALVNEIDGCKNKVFGL